MKYPQILVLEPTAGGQQQLVILASPRFRANDNSQWAPAACDPCSQTDADSRCALALVPFGVQQMPYTSSARSARVHFWKDLHSDN